ncbi:LysR substrate-binding domain-containing protein [Halocynthiibacter namhaensis]|uniref:LysR substrate-binding domain-containing protein n=1 Tax=Halocynthiibacter namhaensis TaxID=1290553 RepID=UPI000578FB9A|nr:LysR substrate-binding domain-containing protein [Halocynthiibacter namhaensis]
MSRRYYDLPSMTTLATFETAARHLSFKQAAQELSVTPGAVSHQIKALEEDTGIQLFERKHRGVDLTPEGEALFEALQVSFQRLSLVLKSIRAGDPDEVTTVGSTSAVASLWLSPSVVRFWQKHPDANVNQIVRDRVFHGASLPDLYIQYGRSQENGLEQTPLYRDQLVPVAAPNLAAQMEGCSLDELAQSRLIYLDCDDKSWTSWKSWFTKLGYHSPLPSGNTMNNFSVALQAAQEGAGVLLGWRRLISPLIESGALVVIGPHQLPAPHRFHLIGRPEAELSAAACQLKHWFLEEVSAFTDEYSSFKG